MPKPTKDDLLTDKGFFEFVSKGQTYNTAHGPRSTAAINGTQQYGATTHTVSEVLQGGLIKSNPADTLLVVNKALTDKLKYMDEEGLTTLSTFSADAPRFSSGPGTATDAAAAANGLPPGAAGTTAGTLNQSWVQSLPLKHSNGATIWQGEGKASLEMHLPTADNIEADKANHLQVPGLDPALRHPYYMDRVGGPIGGETTRQGDPNNPNSTRMSEDASAPGHTGAFGYLTPEMEQWYCSMAWPYKGGAESFRKAGRNDIADLALTLKQGDYKDKKILVYCKETQKGVVCTPGDWGTQPYWSNGAVGRASINGFYIGLSPDVHSALGSTHGHTMLIRFMPDETPIGPYNAASAEQGMTSGGAAGTETSASGTRVVNTLEEMKYAGNKIANHPNLVNQHASLTRSLTEGFSSQTNTPAKFIPAWFPDANRGFYMPSLLNYLWFILEYGCMIDGSLGQGYVHRAKNSSSALSNHAKGGALDIGGIGFGTTVGYSSPQWRSFCDKLFGYLSGLSRDSRASEVGCSYDFMYENSFHVYKDKNPNHLHLGFNENQVGQLIPALKAGTAKPAGITKPGTTGTVNPYLK